MKTEIKTQWLTALRSGEYEQGQERLHRNYGDGRNEYCCLGVLCELAVKEGVTTRTHRGEGYGYGKNADTTHLPDEVLKWSGIPGNGLLSSYINANDSGMDFGGIADMIELNQ